MEEEAEFKILDYDEEIEKVKTLVESCRKELESSDVEAIPYFNKVLNRELEAIVETLTEIDHFHASARSARTALELTAVNLYRYFHPGGSLSDLSFWEKYGLRGLSHPRKSPLLELVRAEILWEETFHRFRESYKDLSEYVHYRVTYHLYHPLPEKVKGPQQYAEVMKLAAKKGRVARIVKATLMKYTLEPALEVLLDLLRTQKRIRSNL